MNTTPSDESDRRVAKSLFWIAIYLCVPALILLRKPGSVGLQTLAGKRTAYLLLAQYVFISVVDGPHVPAPIALFSTLFLAFVWFWHRALRLDRAARGIDCPATDEGQLWIPGPTNLTRCVLEPFGFLAAALLLSRLSVGLSIFWAASAIAHGVVQCLALFCSDD